ncbi:30S ribosomal protein S27ae [Candidatus Pacearchaeota archaeon]|nr:30S ribosomal protein S27ae [Candidatus Pacearchaeota archaeon]
MAKKVKKGKKPHKNKPTSKKYTKYKIEGDKITRERFCPRCGPGVFLMKSQGRVYCGKCHYAEFQGKKVLDEESKNQEQKQETPKDK